MNIYFLKMVEKFVVETCLLIKRFKLLKHCDVAERLVLITLLFPIQEIFRL